MWRDGRLLATYKDGSRDGQLVVVSRDLSTAHYATGIANTLQRALDDWNFIAPQLQDLYVTLNQGKARHAFPFDPSMCMAPLPRAYVAQAGGRVRTPLASGPYQVEEWTEGTRVVLVRNPHYRDPERQRPSQRTDGECPRRAGIVQRLADGDDHRHQHPDRRDCENRCLRARHDADDTQNARR